MPQLINNQNINQPESPHIVRYAGVSHVAAHHTLWLICFLRAEMKKGNSYQWIPLWVDKWLLGSTRIELEPAERAVWIDLLALAGKDDGYIRANENTSYRLEQLAGFLCVPLEILKNTIEKCLAPKVNKLNLLENDILYVVNWEEYRLSPRHKRRLMSSKTDTMSSKADTNTNTKTDTKTKTKKEKTLCPISQDVVAYLNLKLGTSFKTTTKKTQELIKARQKEGFTLEDFKKVIDRKVKQWKTDAAMSKYLRPETLFGNKFEGYKNEPKAPWED